MNFKGPTRKPSIGPLAIALVVATLNILPIACSAPGNTPPGSPPPGTPKTYTTSFPLTENPISEQGNWINGSTVGLDWGNVQTSSGSPGLAFGTVVSGGPPYSDSTAILTGSWGANQKACATVHTVNQNSSIYEEVELRLRTTITAHSITGYELGSRVTSDGSQYLDFVRWNGPLNNWTAIGPSGIPGPGLHNGDQMCATAVGSTLTLYINGVVIDQATDSTYTNGSPGMGFYNQGGTLGNNNDYGFTNFTATDALTAN